MPIFHNTDNIKNNYTSAVSGVDSGCTVRIKHGHEYSVQFTTVQSSILSDKLTVSKVSDRCVVQCACMRAYSLQSGGIIKLITQTPTWQQAQKYSHKHSYVSACCAVYTQVVYRFARKSSSTDRNL